MHDLEEDIRTTAPQPRPEFLTQLEERVEAGFPKPRRRIWPRIQPFVPALATLMILAAIVAPIALFGGNGDDDEESGGSSGQVFDGLSGGGDEGGSSGGADEAASGGEAAQSAEPAAPSAAESAPAPSSSGSADRAAGGADQAPGSRQRVVERRHALTVETPADEFEDTTAEVLNIADSTQTIVQTSNVSERDNRGVATFDLRVPTSRLDDVIRDLSRLGTVTERRATSDDITGSFVSARNRLDDARDTRRALLRALERADTAAEADALRRRIADARRRIAAAERDVRRVRARADRARVSLTVESTGEISDEGSTWTPGDAASDAWRVVEVIVGVALIVLAAIAPFALVGLIALALSRLVRRRRREAALG